MRNGFISFSTAALCWKDYIQNGDSRKLNLTKKVTVHSVLSNTLRDAENMNLLVQSPRSIVCFANLIYANRINSRRMSRNFGIFMPKHLAG